MALGSARGSLGQHAVSATADSAGVGSREQGTITMSTENYTMFVVVWPSAPYDNPNVEQHGTYTTAKERAEDIARMYPGVEAVVYERKRGAICPVSAPKWWPELP